MLFNIKSANIAGKGLLIVMIVSLLSACVGVFIAGAAIGGLVVYEGRNFSSMKTDIDITQEVNKRLSQDRYLVKHTRLIISAYDGVVLLAGQATSTELRDQAGAIVQGVPGVRRVYNEMTISGPISTMAESSDAWITTKVKSQLLAQKELDSSQIKVVTENSTVFLMGKVTKGQSAIAADVARQVHGVQKVVTLFEFLQ
jgi:osmotically-inducible protein OsmY